MALLTLNFESQFLMNNHEVGVILPDVPRNMAVKDFYSSGKKYKVLWLLHGTFGDYTDWIRKSNIELYACERDLIVVMPSALNSNYANWPNFGIGYNMFDYLTEELMPLVYNWLPVSDKREDNYIAGLSMGGWGTSQYVVTMPERFAGAAILSAAPYNVHRLKEDGTPKGELRQQKMIENAGGLEGFLKSPENTWDKFPEVIDKLPPLYFAIGTKDHIYPHFVLFRKYAESIGLRATFEEYEGYRHEWRFWELMIPKMLDFFNIKGGDAENPY